MISSVTISTAPCTPSTLRYTRGRWCRGGMKSVTRTRAAGRVPFLDQDQGALPVGAAGGRPARLGRQQPAAVVRRTEQGGEAGGGVEAGHAQPVERTVPPHQGRRMGVTDQGVVFDPLAHAGPA